MSTNSLSENKLKRFKLLINIASVAIPLVVVILFKIKIQGVDLTFLPAIYACINGITAVFLILALVAIKRKNKNLHNTLINICMILSLVFLLCYVAYHMTSDSTKYEGEYATIYFSILISHIALSVLVVPLVLRSYLLAYEGKFMQHKKLVRFTWPIWFYVAVTGVVVYWMISPFYT